MQQFTCHTAPLHPLPKLGDALAQLTAYARETGRRPMLSRDGPVTLRSKGGRRPLTFRVDGAPVSASPAHCQVGWQPAGPGFYAASVLDADDAAARASVRVK